MTVGVVPVEVLFVDECHSVPIDGQLTFGRDADVVIDDNQYLHRRLGLVRCESGVWWLRNVGSAVSMEMADTQTPSRMTVAPGASVALAFEACTVRFQAGPTTYEIEINNPNAAASSDFDHLDDAGSETITASELPLNDDQRLLLVALCEPRLLDRAAPLTSIPSNKAVAERLGWTITKYNRKLDHLCQKFAKAGVSGLVGDAGKLAKDRRGRLVDYTVTVGLIDEGDLMLLGAM